MDVTPRRIPFRHRMNRAAVAIIRAPVAGEPCLLMMKRAARSRDPWSGQMAFPGGRRDAADAEMLDTALRETREETGIDLASLRTRVRRQSEVVTRSHGSWRPQVVTPFLFDVGEAPSAQAGEEAERLVWVPQSLFAGPPAPLTWRVGPVPVRFPSHEYDGCVIWGLSLMMIRGLREPFSPP